jgi:hypothetical protein
MQTDVSLEWLKIKVYNEITAYLKYPSAVRKHQLYAALADYEAVFKVSGNSDTKGLNDMELAMNHY